MDLVSYFLWMLVAICAFVGAVVLLRGAYNAIFAPDEPNTLGLVVCSHVEDATQEDFLVEELGELGNVDDVIYDGPSLCEVLIFMSIPIDKDTIRKLAQIAEVGTSRMLKEFELIYL